MRNFDSQLLCTFSTFKTYQQEIQSLKEFYQIDGDRIYVLMNMENNDEVFLTYNALMGSNRHFPKTISVHRKKDFNILYSINALNELVMSENNGVFSTNFKLDWTKYRNSIIVIDNGKLKITPTKLVTIFHLK